MKKIQILGSGCAKCKALYANTEEAAKALGIEYSLEKVTDMREIVKTGIMMTPGLMVDGVVKSSGRVPTKEEISKLIGS
jgi:small redox-active disulfide protein 2